nr:hypothetical protein [Corynebacterium auriscanis]
MITVLAVDTSTNFVTCGLVQVRVNGKTRVLAEESTDNVRGHMELLVPHIRTCMTEANVAPADIAAVVVGTGLALLRGCGLAWLQLLHLATPSGSPSTVWKARWLLPGHSM